MSLVPLLFDIEFDSPNEYHHSKIYTCRICKVRSKDAESLFPMFYSNNEINNRFLERHFDYHIRYRRITVDYTYDPFISKSSLFDVFNSEHVDQIFVRSKSCIVFNDIDNKQAEKIDDETKNSEHREEILTEYYRNTGRSCKLCGTEYAIYPADEVIHKHIRDCAPKLRDRLSD